MTETDRASVGGILLAAGGSSRMGRPKQLIQYEGISLIRRAAGSLAQSKCDPKIAVLGAHAAECQEEIEDMAIDACINHDWASGMSSSLRFGLKRLLETAPHVSAVIFLLCDQPLVTAKIIDGIVGEYRRIRPKMIASEYNGVIGVPALFSRAMFDELFKLEGDRGARALIRDNDEAVLRLAVSSAALDIDSPDDLMSDREVDK